MITPRIVSALVLTSLTVTFSAAAAAQQLTKQTVDNQYGGKTELEKDSEGRVVHQKIVDDKKIVREERWSDYSTREGDVEETIRSYDERGRLVLTEVIVSKDKKRIKGTRTPHVYKDDKDAQGHDDDPMVIAPNTGNWTRPMLAARGSLHQGTQTPTGVNDFSVTYMLKHFSDETYKLGVGVDVSHQMVTTPSVAVRAVGTFEFYHGSDDNFTSFQGGARFGFHGTPTVAPFVEATAGIVRWGATNFVMQYGAGADVKLSSIQPWQLRIAGGGATVFADGFHFNALRFAIGVSRQF